MLQMKSINLSLIRVFKWPKLLVPAWFFRAFNISKLFSKSEQLLLLAKDYSKHHPNSHYYFLHLEYVIIKVKFWWYFWRCFLLLLFLLSMHMYIRELEFMCTVCVRTQSWNEENNLFPGAGSTGSCELLCECWEQHPGLLQEQYPL